MGRPGDGPAKGSRMVRQRTSDPFYPKSGLHRRPLGLPIHIIRRVDMRYAYFFSCILGGILKSISTTGQMNSHPGDKPFGHKPSGEKHEGL